ncbi:MAG TPA: hypothetical protein PLD20_01000 [Blastocatellia bacterium]|nr:hypothetical protein [Blastocatellia bacterium]HMV81825.1 hypothetical protein [Blastocatellia bacterium]HMX23994.1 hypothetical protein [Blastocatellia bacterium]HMY70424.1 hypothetical protein [Blastocatellia bacterium]HMZ16513.1 hypothetical protein [Blastocatellia bacterium]
MAELYEAADSTRRCPGEADCERFQISEEPKTDACATCEMLQTKPVQIAPLTSEDQAEIAAMVERVQELAEQQAAGFPVEPHEVSPLEFELLVRWHRAVQVYERHYKAALPGLMATLIKALVR